MKKVYTHRDEEGMEWRFVGSRPVSKLADQIMANRGLSTKTKRRKLKAIRNDIAIRELLATQGI